MKLYMLSLFSIIVSISCNLTDGSSDQSLSRSKRTLGGHHTGTGTSCEVKGSYCSCHYCKCDHGSVHCGKLGAKSLSSGHGKHYCYGAMEGEHCECDYCKCK